MSKEKAMERNDVLEKIVDGNPDGWPYNTVELLECASHVERRIQAALSALHLGVALPESIRECSEMAELYKDALAILVQSKQVSELMPDYLISFYNGFAFRSSLKVLLHYLLDFEGFLKDFTDAKHSHIYIHSRNLQSYLASLIIYLKHDLPNGWRTWNCVLPHADPNRDMEKLALVKELLSQLSTLLPRLLHSGLSEPDLFNVEDILGWKPYMITPKFSFEECLPPNDLPSNQPTIGAQFRWVDPVAFQVVDVIGEGGYGRVSKVKCTGGKYFARKDFFHVDSEAFEKEARIQAGLHHHNVLGLVCCTKDSMKCSLVTELMDSDLHAFVMKNNPGKPPLNLWGVVNVMLDISMGMGYLHNKDIMHRDLKSKNIGVSDLHPMGHLKKVKVMDFGISREGMTPSKLFNTPDKGTRAWMAPEMSAEGDDMYAKYTKSADVYSYGMIGYQLVTGIEPFKGYKNSEIVQKVKMGERPQIPVECPRPLAALIEECWSGDPSKRPSFAEISKRLFQFKCNLILTDQEDIEFKTQTSERYMETAKKAEECTASCSKAHRAVMEWTDKAGPKTPRFWKLKRVVARK